MIFLALMVVVSAILGTVATGMMFDPAEISASPESFSSYIANGSFWAFQKLGAYYGVGDLLLVIFALCTSVSMFSTLLISIDAPLRMLLDNEDSRPFIPSALLQKNAYGAYPNGIRMVAVLSGSIILIHSLVPGSDAVLEQLVKLNSVCMPLRYLWVFYAYIALRRAGDAWKPEYRFVQNKTAGILAGAWCFLVTAFACMLGMYNPNPFIFLMNVLTPLILTLLGIILPLIAARERAKAQG